ncbi:RluA family pseudouridine synthase, partial [Bacillus anthracis]
MSTIKRIVSKEHEGRKIREFLKEELGLSSRLIRSASIDKRIFVDNKAVKMNYVLKRSEEVLIDLVKEETQNIDPENIPIDIVYEDEDIIVVNKGPNMV